MKSIINYIISLLIIILLLHVYFASKYNTNDGRITKKEIYIEDYTDIHKRIYKDNCKESFTPNTYIQDIDTNKLFDEYDYFSNFEIFQDIEKTNYELYSSDFEKFNILKKYNIFTNMTTSGVSDYPTTLRYKLFQIEQPDSVYKFLITSTDRNLQYVSSVLFKDSVLYMSNTPVMTDKNNLKIYYNTDTIEEIRSNLLVLDSASFLGKGLKTNPLKPTIIYSSGLLVSAQDNLYTSTNAYWDNGNKRLGIITVSPSQTLDVNGVLRLRAKSSVSNKQGGELYFNQSTNSFYAVRTNGTEYLIAAPPAPGANYFVGYNYYFGINTYTPAYTLEVNGRLFTDTMSYTVIVSPSDVRLKKNIKSHKKVLEDINKLNVVKFNWDVPKTNRVHKSLHNTESQGLIAQQVEEVYPDFVYSEIDTFKNVDYSKFIPMLIKANQELYEESKQQIRTLDSLELYLQNILYELKNLEK